MKGLQDLVEPVGEGDPPVPGSESGLSMGRRVLRQLRRDRRAVAGAIGLGVVIALALAAPVLAQHVVHHGPSDQYLVQTTDEFGLPTGPSSEFWFGVDSLGRDVFVRVLYGARTSLIVATLSTTIAVALAIVTGMAAGYAGGVTDSVISRLTDVALALPSLLLAIGLVTACSLGCLGGLIQPGIPLIVIVLGLTGWMISSRIIRAQTLSIRERDFVAAAQSQRASAFSILRTEVLPNLTVQIVVLATIEFPLMVLAEAGLSFLGVGVPPDTPSWGKMLEDANQLMTAAWWLMVFPGLFLFVTTMSFNMLGEAVRNALNPRGTKTSLIA